MASDINFWGAKLNHLIFHPLAGVARYRDPQLQMGENNSYLFNVGPNICKSIFKQSLRSQ